MKKVIKLSLWDIVVCIIVIITTSYLFRGCMLYGMEQDEVLRTNNLFQYFNKDAYPCIQAISSISIGNIKIPLMLKEYISFLVNVPVIPVALAKQPFVMLRILYYLYTACVSISIYFFLKQKNSFIAITTTAILVCNPFLYPYIQYGWANIIYGIPLLFFVICIEKHIRTKKRKWLFWGTFFLALGSNIHFYLMWIVVAIPVALLLLYPQKVLIFIKDIKNDIALAAGIFLGLFNFVLHNIINGFPVVKSVWNYIFNIDEYNKKSVNGTVENSMLNSIVIKISSYRDCIGQYSNWFLLIGFLLILIYIIAIFSWIKNGKWHEKKNRLLPVLVTVIAFFLMCITPNAQGSHHITYLIVSLSFSISIAIYMLYSEFRWLKGIVYGISIIIICFCFGQSNIDVAEANINHGNGYFTEQIFDLINYTNAVDYIQDDNLQFIEWGFAPQFYFMNRGEFDVNDIVWSVFGDDREMFLDWYFNKEGNDKKEWYVPIYGIVSSVYSEIENGEMGEIILAKADGQQFAIKMYDSTKAFIDYIQDHDGKCSIENVFFDEGSMEGSGIVLLKIDGVQEIKKSIFVRSLYDEIKSSNVEYSYIINSTPIEHLNTEYSDMEVINIYGNAYEGDIPEGNGLLFCKRIDAIHDKALSSRMYNDTFYDLYSSDNMDKLIIEITKSYPEQILCGQGFNVQENGDSYLVFELNLPQGTYDFYLNGNYYAPIIVSADGLGCVAIGEEIYAHPGKLVCEVHMSSDLELFGFCDTKPYVVTVIDEKMDN